MCGIVGYIGTKEAAPFLLEGLRRLEYRGYDSAGIATLTNTKVKTTKTVGRIETLSALLGQDPHQGFVGIGHTRWATHGAATIANAHPHHDRDQAVTIVHNGVLDNFQALKQVLTSQGYEFQSETDSEVIAHLVHFHLQEEARRTETLTTTHLTRAVAATLEQLRGTYGVVFLFRDFPDVLIAARLGSPLVVGVGQGEQFVASDPSPLAGYTDKIIYLADHQIVMITADHVSVTHRDHGHVDPDVEDLQISATDISLDGFDHYMLKEIHEQPESLRNAMRGRMNFEDATAVFGGLNLTPQELRGVKRIILTGCGTSWHSALYGEYVIESLAQIPVEVEYASELRYRNPPVDHDTLVFAITQSGETADTLGALREMSRKGHHTLAICNVVGSSIAHESAGGIFLHAGPEIGVASTKAFTSQCIVFALLALYFGRLRHTSHEAGLRMLNAMRALPDQVTQALETDATVRRIAQKYQHVANFLYLGRHYNFPTALEGALKLKEISYIHAEGYPAAEMKHGPIALVDQDTPSVFIIPRGGVYDKVVSNVEEVKARGGPVIAIMHEGDERVAALADDVIIVPSVEPWLQPIVNIIPLQLLSYHIANLRGCDVDKPRNLAKSVTVE